MNLLKVWNQLREVPAIGNPLFHLGLKFLVPYTFSISPKILDLREGYARLEMKDRRKVRNHLNSIHAIALTNLGEVTSGLAMLTSIPETHNAILQKLEIEFVKKARGRLIAESHAPKDFQLSETNQPAIIEAQIFDDQQNLVSKLKATWMIGPKRR